MLTGDKARTYSISAKISGVELELIKLYIRASVNAVCNYDKNAEFSVRTLFGGDNRDWGGTPLQKVFEYHFYVDGKSKDEAASRSAIDIGILLKSVLENDERTFELVRQDTGKIYKLKR